MLGVRSLQHQDAGTENLPQCTENGGERQVTGKHRHIEIIICLPAALQLPLDAKRPAWVSILTVGSTAGWWSVGAAKTAIRRILW